MARQNPLLQPFTLGGTTFRNRVVSTAHAPGYAEGGLPGERYIRYHEEKAKGGLALTMFGGSSIITPETAPIYNQLDVSSDRIIPHFQAFARRIHAQGALLMCQISHMGRRTNGEDGDWVVPIAPSSIRDPAHHAIPRAMEEEDIHRVIAAYAAAARRCAEGGLDGAEILVASHLPGQFLSPEANRREDAWGGPLDHRMRFVRSVLSAMRKAVPPGFLISLRMAVDEAEEGGADADDCLTVARTLHQAGLYDLLNLSGLAASTTLGLSKIIGGMAMPLGGYLDKVAAFRAAVGAPVIHASRIADVATAAHAVDSGAVDLVGMTRAHMADPAIVTHLATGRPERIRPCVGAAYCIDRIYAGRTAYCAHNPATGRELNLPQTILPSHTPGRRVVVVGGGPGGMEAARVAALRGHHVTLFEATGQLGGQIRLAARAAWRRDLIGIADWLSAELTRLAVDLRLNTWAEVEDILALSPDIVVIATGGLPRPAEVPGGDLARSTWDELSTPPQPGAVVIYDEDGRHAAISTAEHLARAGADVTLVTPDRVAGRELGGSSYPVYLSALNRAGVRIVTDHRLAGIARSGNGLIATFQHLYSGQALPIAAARVVVDSGTLPNDPLFHALKPHSRNRGEVDIPALIAGTPQPSLTAPGEGAVLFRIGDAQASRDIHGAMLDALRLLHPV